MKQRLLSMVLLVLIGFAGSMTVKAQTPEPTGRWTFENTDNLMAPSVGILQMIPAIVSNNSITLATIGEASITAAIGPTEDKSAIKVPRSSALKIVRAEGATASQSYTLMIDVMAPDASPWNSLLQTAEGNDNDGDLFIHANQIGVNSIGGYFGSIKNNKWYRVVLSYRDGKNILYVNGKKLVAANPDNNDRFKIQPFGFYLFSDEDGELAENYVSEVAFWETPLTDEQVSELGSVVPPTFMEIATPADLSAFAEAVESGADVNGLLTADIDLSTSDYPDLMIGTDANPFINIFDGGGHTITYYYEGNCVAQKWRGLFRAVNGATIRNLRVEGEAYPTDIHFGALIGVAYGTVLVENVVTNVDVTGQRSGVTGDAGMLGANYADITFNNCAVLGPLGNPGSSMYSPYSGWSDGSSKVTLNNCYAACYFKEGTGIDSNSGTLTHGSGTNTFNNCYYLNYIDKEQGTQVTAEQIANGSLCYKLNSNQNNIVWTQAIGVDEYPMPDPNGPRVYGSGTLRCDGTELPDNPLTYSNTESYPTIPDHQFGMDGICTVCGMTDPNAVTQNEDGFYLIGNPEQMYWLYLKIQESDAQLKVLLTDDIDLSNSDFPDLMLGTEVRPFIGIFDGGKHTIHYDYAEVTEKWRGLFAFVKDATIRNLYVEGNAYVTQIHYGALIGKADGTVIVENVVTNVNITGMSTFNAGGEQGDAGMVGANCAQMTFNNCATLGKMGSEISSMYSSFSGWSNGSSSTTLNNCFTICELVEGTRTSSCFTLTHSGGNVTLNNCYYLNTVGRVQGTQITEEQLASGELCFKLNGDQSNITWYQNLDEDEMPVPDDSHYRVYGAGSIFMNVTDEASFNDFVDRVIGAETERLEETYAQKSLEDAYLAELDGLRSAADIDAFITGYNALEEQRQAIQSCAEAYAAYVAKVEYAKNYLDENPDLNNEKVDFLKSYLEELEEPGENYPNGSAVFILDNCLLSEEEIISETAYIDEMLTEAITYTPAPGTDVSLLFTNIDLSDHFNGWEGQVPTGWGTSETSPLYAAECLAAKMDMYQTVTGLPNGIYELRINGAFRPTPYNDFYNVNYAATLYANDIHNFFQANIEDMISVEDVEDGVNCNINGPIADFPIYDETGEEVIGYTMQGIVSCCNAFQAGRYPNYVLCNVTDGQLTIGVRQPGTSLSRDWLGFGNIKVYYYGQLDEAEESLDRVLESQSARAKTILDVYENTIDITDAYATYPNYSKALKDQLTETLAAVEDTTEPAAKYALIERFSELFLQIYESKQAYIHLMDMAEELSNILDSFSEILSDDDFNNLYDLQEMLTDGYANGTMSAEEIYAINLNDYLTFFPEQDEEGYYLLNNVEDFTTFALMVNGGYTQINAKLLADIDLSEGENPNQMIGTQANPFSGTFYGQGHTITYSYDFSDNYCGLFSYIHGATIRNLRVEGDVVTRGIHFGALIGYGDGDMLVEDVITNVYITGEHSGVTGNGGMIGALYGNITFNNCATLGEMGYVGSSMYCGFVAYENSGSSTLNNCYTACMLTEGTGTDYCYTFCRGIHQLNNCYYLNVIGEAQGTQMTLEQFKSGEVCYKLNGDQSDIHWYQSIDTDEFPVLDNTHKTVYIASDGTYTNEKAHTGTQEDPFVVKSATDLSNLIKLLISGRMNYVVMEADVDMADVTDWTPLFNIEDQSNGYPYIDFDGRNHVISNLTSNTTGAYDYCGLFGVLCGNVRNLGVENATVECAGGTGILAGYLGHSTYGQTCYIENVWVTGKVTANGYCGGMFGNIADESHITNCYANVEVNGSGDLTGGIIGRVRNKVVMNNVYAAGTINRGGGIIGGGFQAATPDGSYTNVAVWNNTENNFGPARSTDTLSGILYYNGSNFADLQSQVVAWDPTVWSCDMEPGSYPILAAFDPDGIKGVMADESSQSISIYNIAGQRLSKVQKGINIVNGKKVLVK